MDTQKITWRALEYKMKDRTVDWFWAVGLISVLIAAIAVFLGNFLFAVFIIIACVTLLSYAVRRPSVLEYEVGKRGIKAGSDFYPYSSLEAFWIDFSEDEHKLLVRSKKHLMPLVTIPVAEIDTEILHNFLLEKLPETEMEEPFSQKFMDVLGF